ncbi:RNA polymerase sigma factor [Streptomyces sp. NPDC006879]|uniref:RNA polymerase sigma factor n=1 Tax=Streptomyces sp. NPDC006879 TaxID=3364767 RepID=UPI003683F256
MVKGASHREPLCFDGELGQRLLDNFDAYQRKTLGFLRCRYPVLTGYHEDIWQEAFVRTARACQRGRLDPARDPYHYLRKAAENLARDAVEERREEPVDEERLRRAQESVAARGGPETRASEEIREVLRPAIDRMRATQRRAVVELQSLGLEDQEIADNLRVPRQQVAVQRSRAVDELQSMESIRNRTRAGHLKRQPPREGHTGE